MVVIINTTKMHQLVIVTCIISIAIERIMELDSDVGVGPIADILEYVDFIAQPHYIIVFICFTQLEQLQ